MWNTKCDILRPVRTKDGIGGFYNSPQTWHTDLPCRINWTKGIEGVQFGKVSHQRVAKVYCNVVDIKEHDQMVYGDKTYEIVYVNNTCEANKFLTFEIRNIR